MKKINLKSILKKTFNKKIKKKVVKTKKVIKSKIKKPKIIKKRIKQIIKTSRKVVKKKVGASKDEIKSENIRIIKNNDQKPEIKKVKTQETEKREYKIKDYVVYPKHGVGQINEFKK